MPGTQLELPYIPHTIEGEIVSQRQRDGYINATAMCQAGGKLIGHYFEAKATKAFLSELSSDIGIPISELVQIVKGGAAPQGTWVHPQVAINLAQWVSPKFAVQVTKWIYDWMRGAARPGPSMPFHLRRYVANQQNVPAGHFSVLTEMTLALVAPMEAAGYQLPERLWPDISQGKMFAKFLREELGVDTSRLPTYWHVFEDGRPAVQAKAYPNQFLHIFRDHFADVWLPKRAVSYFRERDMAAIPFLQIALPETAVVQAIEVDLE